jgi:hypothetical protein
MCLPSFFFFALKINKGKDLYQVSSTYPSPENIKKNPKKGIGVGKIIVWVLLFS